MNEKAVLARLATRIINTPLMIHPDKLVTILGVIGDRIGLDVPGRAEIAPFRPASERETTDEPGVVAVIPVHDTLVHRTRGLDALSGLNSYEEIRKSFRRAVEDPEVGSILFDIDSPGGEAAGVFDLVDEIFEAREVKPVYAFVNETAYSAAYAIASAAEEIFVPRTGGLGSVGVVALHVDQSGFDAQRGLKYTYIYAGARKIDFSPHKPLSQEAFGVARDEIEEVYNLFIETVARNRGLPASAVRVTEAGIFQGRRAVDAGLADRVTTWDQALQYITSRRGGTSMDAKEVRAQLEELLTLPEVDAAAILKELGYAPAGAGTESADTDPETIMAEGVDAGRKEALERVKGILDLCKLAGMPRMAAELILSDLTVDQARERILKARAEEGDDREIISTVSGLSDGGVNPLLADAEKRAGEAKRN